MPSPVKALLDANVLYSNHLRNLLLQLAQNDLFDAKWSELVEQEWLRNMEPLTRQRIAIRTIPLIRDGFPGALWKPKDVEQPADLRTRADPERSRMPNGAFPALLQG